MRRVRAKFASGGMAAHISPNRDETGGRVRRFGPVRPALNRRLSAYQVGTVGLGGRSDAAQKVDPSRWVGGSFVTMNSMRLCAALAMVLTAACSGALDAADGDHRPTKGDGAVPTDAPTGEQDGPDGDPSSGSPSGGKPGTPGNEDPIDDTPSSDPGPGPDGPASNTCETDTYRAIERQSLRINDWQFENTLAKLFPFSVRIQPQLHSTVVGDHLFSTFPGANEVLSDYARDFVDVAEELALQAVDHLDEMLPCDPADTSESECAAQFAADFGQKAYRRPLTSAERDHFAQLYAELRSGSDGLDFDLAIAGLIQGVLLAPDTLYLLERGEPSDEPGVLRLNGYEVASRLSYLFLDEPPDAALLAAAEADELQDAGDLRRHARRLLDDARSRGVVSRFVGEWFGMADKDFTDHVDPQLARAWAEEVDRMIGRLVADGGTISDLLDGDQTYVNEPLAEHYGLSSNPSSGPDDWQLVTLPSERRGGLLTTAQFAAATSLNNSTSIIHRGKAVREQLLCGLLAPPDPAFLLVELELPDDPTVRDRMDSRLSAQTCGGCHMLMDPIGIGMEDMDQNGSFRSSYSDGKPVDAGGRILGTELEQDFTGVAELAQRIGHSDLFRDCATDQWLRYASGRSDLGKQHACLLDELSSQVEAGGDSLDELLLAVVGSDAFIYRLEEETP